MKIIVSQRDKKILITFEIGKVVDKCSIDRAEDFLTAVDKFLKKPIIGLEDFAKNARLEFVNVSLLTERIIRSIILGLRF